MPTVNPSPLLPTGPSADTAPALELRVKVRWSALELDAALANGADPASSEELALRAQQLASEPKREQLTQSIGDLLRLVHRRAGVQLPTTRAPINWDQIRRHHSALVELCERIEGDGPHSVRGLALASLLVYDAGSPLYSHELSRDRLGPALDEALTTFKDDQ